MARATWKGSLKLSLISIPIRVFPATTTTSDVSFRQLHRKCHTPIQLKKWCPHCKEEVASGDIVKGYESAKGQYVLVTEEDIKKVRPESTHIVEISQVLEAPIDPVYVERVYYLAPDNRAAGEAFSVFREALQDVAAIGRLALHGREYLVAVRAQRDALVLYTLRTEGEVRASADLDGLEFAPGRPKPEEVKLARQILNSFDKAQTLAHFTDHYQEALRAMLAARQPVTDVAAAAGGRAEAPRVVNLMDALRQSLATVSDRKKRPARAGTRAPVRGVAAPAPRHRRRAS